MDRIIEDKRRIKPKHWKYMAGGALVLIIVLFVAFRDNESTYKIEKDKLNIVSVKHGEFKDYIAINGRVAPISTIYLDAIEGGRVEQILVEEGANLQKGDVILELSNSNLNLSILNSEAQLAEKSNFLREVRIRMEQQKLDLETSLLQADFDLRKHERIYQRNRMLYEEQLISEEEFLLSEEAYYLSEQSRDMIIARKKNDSIFRESQIAQLEANLENMDKNMELVHQRLENLKIKAPVAGQLGLLDAEIGQSIQPGQRIGQINVLTSFKIEAEVDEHYIDRVRTGLQAQLKKSEGSFKLKIKKVYPSVKGGRFIVDLTFADSLPQNLRIGQSHRLQLELGISSESLLLDRGGFYQSSGGQWVYVLDPSGDFATRREIQIGRQNPKHYEVQGGLEEGEEVIISNYDLFGDNERIVFK